MIRTLQIIYDRLHIASSKFGIYEIDASQAIRFLSERYKIEPHDELYRELLVQINSLREKYLPAGFIERFCLGKISKRILIKYPINVAEAFVLSYVMLTTPANIDTLYFKMGNSGLISPTIIDGARVEDVEVIARFIIKSLTDADLIIMTDNRYVIPGKQLSLD